MFLIKTRFLVFAVHDKDLANFAHFLGLKIPKFSKRKRTSSKITVQKWPKCDIEREVTLAAKDGYLTISVTIFSVSMLKC